jgi:tRNA A64-2'-O-ribosylphosphate transferase
MWQAAYHQNRGLAPAHTHACTQVSRQLKRDAVGLHNCVCSIVEDAGFVEEIRALYPTLPLAANLRCGRWYVRTAPDANCYFKSTDGHMGNWSFSLNRLNLPTAQLAAAHGGVLIVDATRNAHKQGFPVRGFWDGKAV